MVIAVGTGHAEQPVDLITSQDPFLTALVGLRLRHRLRVPLIVQLNSPSLTIGTCPESRRNFWLHA